MMDVIDYDYNSPMKDVYRNLTRSKGRVYESIFDLAGPQCLSILGLEKAGNINYNTKIVIADRSAANLEKSYRFLNRRGYKSIQPYQYSLTAWPSHIRLNVEWCNLDTCSTLSEGLLNFIRQINFLPEGELNVWVTGFRNATLMKNSLLHKFLKSRAGINVVSEITLHAPFTNAAEQVMCAAIYTALNRYDKVPIRPGDGHYIMSNNMMHVFRFVEIITAKEQYREDALVLQPVESPTNHEHHDIILAGPLLSKCFQAVSSGNSALMGAARRQLRIRLRDQSMNGKDPKWVKAGWKAYLSRHHKQNAVLPKLHEFVDSLFL